MHSRTDEIIVSLAQEFNLSPDKAKELAEIGCDMTFSGTLDVIVPQLGKVIDNEASLKEFLLSMLKLGAIKYNYDLGSSSDDEEE